ncbi:RNA polymerase sigma factor [Nakamurella antarctica]|uniref:RNA polymerase sigma factor n=1 Tax=Nakamurella antarctica TaxID=1902245 RepID=UPI0019D10FC1|nr:RNA polymerase sigma factor [Nakamurella antarctica]
MEKGLVNGGSLVDVRGGDPVVVFAGLFDAYAEGVHRYLFRRVGAVADDLLSETFAAAIAGRAGYDPDLADPRAWLFGIASNLLRRHWRQEQRELSAFARVAFFERELGPDLGDEAVSRVEADRRCRELAGSLLDLSEGDRDVLLLTAWAGLDSNQVAAALDIPVGTVRSRMHRVRRQLRSGHHFEKSQTSVGEKS